MYIDDGINGRTNYDAAKIAGQTVYGDLRAAGFVCNAEKCNWEPTQEGRWLGMIVNTSDMTFTAPPEKINKLKAKLGTCLKSGRMTAKALASIAGTLSSLSLAVGPLTRLQTREMYADVGKCDMVFSVRFEYRHIGGVRILANQLKLRYRVLIP